MKYVKDRNNPSILIIYHFFPPDDVASASHMYQFAQELLQRGWHVTVLTSNRYCRDPLRSIPIREENLRGIHVIRLFRPAWNQADPLHRIMNTVWMIAGWMLKLMRMKSFDVVVVGSDPAFAPLIIPFIRFFRKGRILAHWCYDLYPEILVVDGKMRINTNIIALSKMMMGKSYRSSNLIVDLGSCMRKRLDIYHHEAHKATLIPWALVEPDHIKPSNAEIRKKMFGDAELGLLYSGTLGRAHDYELFLKLARLLRRKSPKIHICFACRGTKADTLKKVVTSDDTNISFIDFVEEYKLEGHLNAADIHLVSLKNEWGGLVVPSKFFGSLAVAKPVIHAGASDSTIAEIIKKYKIGFHLTSESLEEVACQLDNLVSNPSSMNMLRERVFNVYHSFFSRKIITDKWDKLLRELIIENK